MQIYFGQYFNLSTSVAKALAQKQVDFILQ